MMVSILEIIILFKITDYENQFINNSGEAYNINEESETVEVGSQ